MTTSRPPRHPLTVAWASVLSPGTRSFLAADLLERAADEDGREMVPVLGARERVVHRRSSVECASRGCSRVRAAGESRLDA